MKVVKQIEAGYSVHTEMWGSISQEKAEKMGDLNHSLSISEAAAVSSGRACFRAETHLFASSALIAAKIKE